MDLINSKSKASNNTVVFSWSALDNIEFCRTRRLSGLLLLVIPARLGRTPLVFRRQRWSFPCWNDAVVVEFSTLPFFLVMNQSFFQPLNQHHVSHEGLEVQLLCFAFMSFPEAPGRSHQCQLHTGSPRRRWTIVGKTVERNSGIKIAPFMLEQLSI